MTTLLELDSQLTALDNQIDSLEGEITAELAQQFQELLDKKESTYEAYLTKLDNIAALIKSRKQWVEIREQEAKRMAKLAERDRKTVDWLTNYLQKHLECKQTTKLRTKRFNLTVANNGGKQPITVDDIDLRDLPQRFRKVAYSPDKEAIREALESGEALDFARFAERGTHLRIR